LLWEEVKRQTEGHHHTTTVQASGTKVAAAKTNQCMSAMVSSFLRALLLVWAVTSIVESFVPEQQRQWRWTISQELNRRRRQHEECAPPPRRPLWSPPSSLLSLHAESRSRKNSLSAAEQERRNEDQRRRERKTEVVVGKTSAVQGAKDYTLDVTSTEEEWMRQASTTEREVFRQTERGLQMLKMLRVDEALEAFDAVFQLKPDAYLWQAGIARFYKDDFYGAAEVLARCAEIYETRFGEPASEERIWRNACLLKTFGNLSRKERKQLLASDDAAGAVDALLPKATETNDTADLLRSERRKVIRIARDLFDASVSQDHTGIILARAKLRSIGGVFDEQQQQSQRRGVVQMDHKMWKISSWYYLGLHYDVIGDAEESKRCMKRALRLSPNANGSDITHTLPMLHMTCRDWFDDEAFDEEEQSLPPQEATDSTAPVGGVQQPTTTTSPSSLPFQSVIPVPDNIDPVLVESIRSSIEKMRYVDLQDVLKVRSLRYIGSKEELQGRLFHSLLSDSGLMP